MSNATLECKNQEYNLRELLKGGFDRKFTWLNFIALSSVFFIIPMLFVDYHQLNSMEVIIITPLITYLSLLLSFKRKWSVSLILVSLALCCFLVWDNSRPTDGWATIFYTEKQIEVFREIKSMKVLVSKIENYYYGDE